MERIHATGISKEEYTRNFKIKQSDVPYINGRPTWTTINLIQDAIEANLVAIHDVRDRKYGKLLLLHDTSQFDGGPATQVTASSDQGTPVAWTTGTDKERESYLIEHYRLQDEWMCDYAAEQACIDFSSSHGWTQYI